MSKVYHQSTTMPGDAFTYLSISHTCQASTINAVGRTAPIKSSQHWQHLKDCQRTRVVLHPLDPIALIAMALCASSVRPMFSQLYTVLAYTNQHLPACIRQLHGHSCAGDGSLLQLSLQQQPQ